MEPRITVSRSAIRRRPSVQALQSGGYGMAKTPEENQAELAYGKGQHTSPQFGNVGNDPRRPLNESVLNAQAEEMNRATLEGIQDEEQEERLRATEDPNRMRFRPFAKSFREQGGQMQWAQSPWRNFFQSLANRGVDNVRTGAVAGYAEPGFFDNQSSSMMGLRDAAHERDINRLNAADTNRSAADVQNFRRRGY